MHLFSFRLGIFIFFRMLRQIFLSCLVSFSAFFRPPAKNNLLFFHPDHPFSEIFSLRRDNFSCLFYVGLRKFSVCFHNFFAFLELFQKKNPLFSLSITQFQTFFPCHRDNFHVFSRAGKEIFLPVFIIFVLFPGLFKGKILIFRNEFSARTNIFSIPWGVFPDFFSCHPIKNSILPEVFSAPSGRNFHLSGSFPYGPDARAPARA